MATTSTAEAGGRATDSITAPFSSGSEPNSSSRIVLSGSDIMAIFVGLLALMSLTFLTLTFIRRRVKFA